MFGLQLFALALQTHHMHEAPQPSTPDLDSLFNHHLAGGLVILVALFSYVERTQIAERRWVRYLWPLPLLFLGVFLMMYSDNPQFWPFGFSRWLPDPAAVQHKIFALVAILLGLIELFRRTGRLTHPAWPHVLSVLMLGAGVFLFMHRGDHHSHVIHVEHMWMGTEAVALSLTKIVADLRPRIRWLGLYAVPALLLALGLQLFFYVE